MDASFSKIAKTPEPPYYSVTFTSLKRKSCPGYEDTAVEMETLAKSMPGYLGFESCSSDVGISISYWKTLEDVKRWKYHPLHVAAQKTGKEIWYHEYKVRIAKVERDYGFEAI